MKRLLMLVLTAALAAPVAANAYIPSPRYGAFELKFGPYTPNVDEEPGLNGTPFADIYGDDWMFMTLLELDWQFLQLPFLSLGVGGQLGYGQVYAKEKNEYNQESADYTVFNMMPYALLLVLRVDVLANQLGVPLVPYVKAGLNWHLWWVVSGGSIARETDDPSTPERERDKASGGTIGWQVSPGLAIRLDGFDTMSARTFDNETGINHSYLFIEFMFGQVEGLGRDGYMHLSPTNLGGKGTFFIGLAVEF